MSAALSFTVLDDGRVVAAASNTPAVAIGAVRYLWPDWFVTADLQGAQFVDAVMWPDGTVLVAAHAQNLLQGNICLMRCGQAWGDGFGEVRWAVDLGPATSNAKVMLDDLGRLIAVRFCQPDVTFHVIDLETGAAMSAVLLPGVPSWARSVLDLTPDGQVIYVPPVPGSLGGVACQFPITRGNVTIAAGFNVAQCLIEIDGVVGTLVDGSCFDPRLSRNGHWFCCHDGRGHVSSGLVPAVAPPLVVPTVPMPPVENVEPLPADALVIGISFNSASVRPCNATFPVRCAPEAGLAVIAPSDPAIAPTLAGVIATWITDNPGETCEQMIDRVRGDARYVQHLWVVPDGRGEPLPASILSRLRPGDLLGVEIAPHAETVAESVALAPCLELQRQSDADNVQLIINASIAYRVHGWKGLGVFAFGRSDVSMEPLRPYLARLCRDIAPVGVWPVVATPAPHPHPTPEPIPAPHPTPAPIPVPVPEVPVVKQVKIRGVGFNAANELARVPEGTEPTLTLVCLDRQVQVGGSFGLQRSPGRGGIAPLRAYPPYDAHGEKNVVLDTPSSMAFFQVHQGDGASVKLSDVDANGPYFVAFGPDGVAFMAAGNGDSLQLLDAATGQALVLPF